MTPKMVRSMKGSEYEKVPVEFVPGVFHFAFLRHFRAEEFGKEAEIVLKWL